MNEVILRGTIKDIEYSHTTNNIEFYKANIITEQKEGVEYVIPVKFKRFCNKYQNNQKVCFRGNIRSYSTVENGKNTVRLYVFTYQDAVEDEEVTNRLSIDGRICKRNSIRIDKSGKCSLSFILANNIDIENSQHHFNVYVPCVAFGKNAIELNKKNVGDKLSIHGYLRSRSYKKKVENSEDYEIRITHELVVTDIDTIEDTKVEIV